MPKEIYRIEIPIETVDEYSKGLGKAKKDIANFEKAVGATTKDVEDLGDAAEKTEKEVKDFGDSTKKVTKQVDDLGNSSDKTSSKVSKFDKSMSRMQKRLDRMNKRRDLIIGVKDFATQTINRIDRMTNRLIRGSYRFSIKAIDRATRIVGAIKRSIFSIPTAITVALSVVGINKLKDSTVGAAMRFEEYEVAMTHWLDGNTKKAKELITWMGQFADSTPFSSPDLFPALVQGVSISNGDITKSQRLLKIASDMSALSGGTRTVEDAMLAIGNAQMGNFEMMKGFGMQITQKDFKKMGGWEGFLKTIEKEFKDGAKKLSATSTGILATLRGYRGSMLRTLGDGILLPMKPRLDAINKWLENNQKTWGRWKGVVQDAGKQASEWLFSSLEKGFSHIKTKYLENDEFKKLDFKGKIQFVWEDIKGIFSSKIQPELEGWWKGTGKPWAVSITSELGGVFVKGIYDAAIKGLGTLWEVSKGKFKKEGNIAGGIFADAILAIIGVKLVSGIIKIFKGAKYILDFFRGFSLGGSRGGAPTPGNTRSTRSEKHNKNGNSKGGSTNTTRSGRHTPKSTGGGWSKLLKWGGGPLGFLMTFFSDPLSVSAGDVPLDYDSSGKNAFGGTAAKPNKFNTPTNQLQGEPKGGDIQSASSLLTEKITNSATSFQTLDETIKGFGGNVDAASEFFMEGITSAGSNLKEFAEWTMQLAAVMTTSGLMMVIALQQNALHLTMLATVSAFVATGMMGSGIELISSMQMSTLSMKILSIGASAISSGIISNGAMLLASISQTINSFRTLSSTATMASSWVLSINGIQSEANSVKSALNNLATRINNMKLPTMPSLPSGSNSSSDVSRGATLSAYANGGYINRPHLGLVGEAGPEMIIPLSSGRRGRAMELYERTGQMLGVEPYKDGGLVGKFIDNNESAIIPSVGTTIVIDGVKTEVNITVQGDSSELDTKGLGEKIADDVANAIIRKANEISRNMPIPVN